MVGNTHKHTISNTPKDIFREKESIERNLERWKERKTDRHCMIEDRERYDKRAYFFIAAKCALIITPCDLFLLKCRTKLTTRLLFRIKQLFYFRIL